MTRNGKIARLPQPIREQINRRLQNGDEGKQITEWLNTLLQVQSLLAAEFDGQPVTETNLSHWKLGGYADWEAQEEALAAVSRFGADAAELGKAAGGQVADQLSICLAARIALALQEPPSNEDASNKQLERLRHLCANLAALRRGDQGAQWLRLEREKFELEEKKYEDQAAARKKEAEAALKDPGDGAVTKETLDKAAEALKLL